MIYSYGYICYLKTYDRTWELSLFSCYLNSVISFLFMSFKPITWGKSINVLVVLKKFKQ